MNWLRTAELNFIATIGVKTALVLLFHISSLTLAELTGKGRSLPTSTILKRIEYFRKNDLHIAIRHAPSPNFSGSVFSGSVFPGARSFPVIKIFNEVSSLL